MHIRAHLNGRSDSPDNSRKRPDEAHFHRPERIARANSHTLNELPKVPDHTAREQLIPSMFDFFLEWSDQSFLLDISVSA
jgi:hypothetical protein